MGERYFSDVELKEMGTLTLDLLNEAIEAGDKEKAKHLAKTMFREWLGMHDMYVDWVAGLLDYLLKNYGEAALYESLRQWQLRSKPVDGRNIDFKNRVKFLVHALKGHLVPLKIEEDEEKVTITMDPCGSGQRLVQKGCYGPPCNFSRIQEPHVMTWGLTDFPVYCTHEPVIERVNIERLGYLPHVALPGDKVGSTACTFCIYKNTDDIPEEFYKRVGRQKPGKE